MNQKNQTVILIIVFILLVIVMGYYFFRTRSTLSHLPVVPAPPTTQSITPSTTTTIEYQNTEYGFTVALPQSWKGFSVVTDTWKGTVVNGSQGDVATEQGPLINIRHPLWTTTTPRQDIPVMVFTLAQWEKVQQEKLSVSAAPIPPRELGRNATYVFALPARYNFAFLPGNEEVEQIINSNALRAH